MSSALKRRHPATGTVAMVLALLALLASAAGAGYAAGQIGTADIQNGAVTSKKIDKNAVTAKHVKDGSLKVADLAHQEAQHKPTLGNGGEGDCVWQSAEAEVAGLGAPTYRLDRDGRVILSGTAIGPDGSGGDADCDPQDAGQASDGIIFTLPAGYVPARTQYLPNIGGLLLIVGPQGYVSGGISLPPGAVFALESAILDGIEFDPAGSTVVVAKATASGRWTGDPLR